MSMEFGWAVPLSNDIPLFIGLGSMQVGGVGLEAAGLRRVVRLECRRKARSFGMHSLGS